MNYADRVFTEQTVSVDANQFRRCRFVRCNLTYAGGKLPFIDSCHLEDTTIKVIGQAENTLKFFRNLYAGGLVSHVESMFDMVRQKGPPVPPIERR